eukprot:scaffold205626_cov25-Tisochrysis_lutea.AAC.3
MCQRTWKVAREIPEGLCSPSRAWANSPDVLLSGLGSPLPAIPISRKPRPPLCLYSGRAPRVVSACQNLPETSQKPLRSPPEAPPKLPPPSFSAHQRGRHAFTQHGLDELLGSVNVASLGVLAVEPLRVPHHRVGGPRAPSPPAGSGRRPSTTHG